MAEETPDSSLLELATELTIAWLSNPNTRASADEVPVFLNTMHGAVTRLAAPQVPTEEPASAPEYVPAVSVRRSLASKDHLISLIDGKPYKTLKRHLSSHGLTPAEYRERYGLKADYPMVAEAYAEMRRGLAKKIGLGNTTRSKVAAAKTATKPATAQSPARPAGKSPAKPAEKTSARKSPALKSPSQKSSGRPAAKTPANSAEKSQDKPAAKSQPQPMAKSPAKPAATSRAKPAARFARQPTAKSPAEPVAKSPAETAVTSEAKPATKSPAKPAEKSPVTTVRKAKAARPRKAEVPAEASSQS